MSKVETLVEKPMFSETPDLNVAVFLFFFFDIIY